MRIGISGLNAVTWHFCFHIAVELKRGPRTVSQLKRYLKCSHDEARYALRAMERWGLVESEPITERTIGQGSQRNLWRLL